MKKMGYRAVAACSGGVALAVFSAVAAFAANGLK